MLPLDPHAVVEAKVRVSLSDDEQTEAARHRRIPVAEARIVAEDPTPVRIADGMDVRRDSGGPPFCSATTRPADQSRCDFR